MSTDNQIKFTKRMEFLFLVGSKIDITIRWQRKLLNILYRIIRWMNTTECENEGHLNPAHNTKDSLVLCPRCMSMIYNKHYKFGEYQRQSTLLDFIPTYEVSLYAKNNIPYIGISNIIA